MRSMSVLLSCLLLTFTQLAFGLTTLKWQQQSSDYHAVYHTVPALPGKVVMAASRSNGREEIVSVDRFGIVTTLYNSATDFPNSNPVICDLGISATNRAVFAYTFFSSPNTLLIGSVSVSNPASRWVRTFSGAPTGCAVDGSTGDVVNVSAVNGSLRIRKFNGSTGVTIFDQSVAAGVSFADKLVVTPNGRIYVRVGTSGGVQLWAFSKNGNLLWQYVPPSGFVLGQIHRDNGEFILVSEGSSSGVRMRRLDMNGVVVHTMADSQPGGVTSYARSKTLGDGSTVIWFCGSDLSKISLARFDSSGAMQWNTVTTIPFLATRVFDNAADVDLAVDGAGNAYVTYNAIQGGSSDYGLAQKFSGSGTLLWTQVIPSPGSNRSFLLSDLDSDGSLRSVHTHAGGINFQSYALSEYLPIAVDGDNSGSIHILLKGYDGETYRIIKRTSSGLVHQLTGSTSGGDWIPTSISTDISGNSYVLFRGASTGSFPNQMKLIKSFLPYIGGAVVGNFSTVGLSPIQSVRVFSGSPHLMAGQSGSGYFSTFYRLNSTFTAITNSFSLQTSVDPVAFNAGFDVGTDGAVRSATSINFSTIPALRMFGVNSAMTATTYNVVSPFSAGEYAIDMSLTSDNKPHVLIINEDAPIEARVHRYSVNGISLEGSVISDASLGSTARAVTSFGVSSGRVVYFEEGGRIGFRQFNSSLGTVGSMTFIGPF